MDEQSVLVVGPGSVGLTIAAGLRRAEIPVAILGRDKSDERLLSRHGFSITSPEGSTHKVSKIQAARAGANTASAAFVCVKSGDAARAAAAIKRWVSPEAPIVALQNGIGHEKIFRRAFGSRRTVIGVCYFAAERVEQRRLIFHGGTDIILAKISANGRAADKARTLLSRAGFHVHLKDDEASMLWTKAAFNAAVNPLGAICGVESGRLDSDPALRAVALAALSEAMAAVRAAGQTVGYADMAGKLLLSCRKTPKQVNSMLQDLSAGRRTESRAILGPLLSAARRGGVPTPTLTLLAAIVDRLERRLS